ncbi:allantoinase [Alkalihalobacillus xiaoxiensis]|uniref:Allantoinase n=1 Tax=Shouchella xiaoxiensis TaxID=766895 RepID=A0ABS2SS32_9BACI|nr:allantoinase AllB [Shouchella xiaoxiensis]MBM7837806.1 allantoinase [Shouchella xiaoxiensis]
MIDRCITGGRVVLHDRLINADIGIVNGKIASIGKVNEAIETIDAKGQLVFAGGVDTHVHFSEPGRTEWEGFETGSMALAAGGVTTYAEMPLNALPATTNRANLQLKLDLAKTKNVIDYSFYGGLTNTNLNQLEELAISDVVAFKCFLSTCGSDEPGDFSSVDDETLLKGMEILARKNKLLCLHAEDATLTNKLEQEKRAQGKTTATDFVESRPIETEVLAVNKAITAAKQTGCAIHFVHISSAEAVAAIEQAKRAGVHVTVESCPHYFVFSAEQLEELGPLAKCQPPLRPKAEVEKLWDCLFRGEIDWITSDHSPCTIDMKAGDFFSAWGGISGCQNTIDLFFDEAVKKRGMSEVVFSQLIARNPAQRFGLAQKGEIAIGKDADFFFLDDKESYTLKKEDLYYKNQFSPYVGRKIGCRVTKTIVRGQVVYTLGEPFAEERSGRLVQTT